MNELLLQFKNFGFQYNAQSKPTLYDIDLEVRRGEKILIAGPSGCGKSTLAHCINGLIPFSYNGKMSGSVTVCGKETKKLSLFEISKHVGTVLQDSDGQFVGLTVAEDIAFALENDCVGEPELHERVYETAKKVGIETHLTHAPGALSGGQKQRVSLAGVLVDDVDILLFDEPLANLDPATGKQTIELIDELQKQTGAAVIIIEHRIEDVLHCPVDRVVLMQNGRIISDGPADELLSAELLSDNGIREPLYLTALKYAGVPITPAMHPASLNDLTLSEEQKEKVREWFKKEDHPVEKKDTPVVLRAEEIRFGYQPSEEVLHGITAEIREGELLAVVGTNGAGKSTFAKVICGFEKQQEGKLTYRGASLDEDSIKERADRIGYVMQNPNQMISKVQIFDEVALGLVTRGVPEEEIRPRVEEALKICGLFPFRNWPVSALSYGQKKRVTIASILVLRPEIIILDEPTAGQDYRHYTDIMEFLEKLHESGMTIVMVTHDMHLMLEYATRCIVFSDGQIIADETGAEVLTDRALVEKASLKETSLYTLAERCGIPDARSFVQCFIDYERRNLR